MSDPVRFYPDRRPSSFRKIAAGMWRAANDPSVYGFFDLDATALLAYIEKARAEGTRLTVTHCVAKAIALAIATHPKANTKVRWWGRITQRDAVNIFLQVAMDGGEDLSGVLLKDCDRKKVSEIAAELSQRAEEVRAHKDKALEQSRNLFFWLPWWLVRALLRFSSFLVNELHLDLRGQGMPRDPFGSAMVTNVGAFGVETAFAPLVPISRTPILVLVTTVKERPWAERGELSVRPVLRLCATIDHRLLDGVMISRIGNTMREYLEAPERLDEPSPFVPPGAERALPAPKEEVAV